MSAKRERLEMDDPKTVIKEAANSSLRPAGKGSGGVANSLAVKPGKGSKPANSSAGF
jgi:hypothetical protein